MDMMGIDGLKPISPSLQGNNYHILIAVNYFTRYTWAVMVLVTNGLVVVKLLKSIASTVFSGFLGLSTQTISPTLLRVSYPSSCMQQEFASYQHQKLTPYPLAF